MVQPQLVKIGGPWSRSMIRVIKGSMEGVHGPGVHGPGVHALYFVIVVNHHGYSCTLIKHMEPGSCCVACSPTCVACNCDISDSCTWISISLGSSLFM